MKRVHKKHLQAIRWMHWINFPVLFLMIWSGLLIYWANDIYRIGTGTFTLFHFFPDHFYKFLGVEHRLAEGMALHFFFMWFFAFNGSAYVVYTVISGEWRHLLLGRHSQRPANKYKRAQRIAYTTVIVMGAGSILTGVAIYKPVQFAWLTGLLGGYESARWEHFLLTIGYCLFFMGHITQVVRAGWNNLRAMLTGYELVDTGATKEDLAGVGEIRKKTRRSFITGGLATLAAAAGWKWLRTRREDEGLPWPLRLSHEVNGELARDYFSPQRLAPTFPAHAASEPRIHGSYGLDEDDFDPSDWRLAIVGLANPQDKDSEEADLLLTLEEIKRLPRAEMVTQMKCIEGWSVIVRWTGVRLADVIAKYPPLTKSGEAPDVPQRPDDLVSYVGLETPDSEYYVSIDMESALHPQTLLCYEMNGQPLSLKHGAPLRLVSAVKYGIKNIKRIGKITYTDIRPADYWAERGYDWYSGH